MDRETRQPTELPAAPRRHPGGWRGWGRLLRATLRALATDRCSMAAAGCAFYATLALFPAITTLVSAYGLVFDRESVIPQLRYLQAVLPPPAYALIAGRVQALVLQPAGTLGLQALVGLVVSFWSAATGTKSVLSALNVAYDEEERRSFLRFQAVALGMTLLAVLTAVLGMAVLVFVPVVITFLGLAAHAAGLIHAAGLAMLVAYAAASIAVLYRLGPSRTRRRAQRIAPGTALATVLWLVASAALSFYVMNLPSFGATYGSLGAVVGVMLWFYLTVYAVLVGAEFNSRLEQAAGQ